MKHIKVSLYVREHGTRAYNKVPDRNKPNYPPNTTYVLRYGSTWETLNVGNLSDATAKCIERELELLRGWRPIAKPKQEATTSSKMLERSNRPLPRGNQGRTYAKDFLCIFDFTALLLRINRE